MELSPRQRTAVFIGVVIALAALGYYLVVPAVTHSHGSAHAASTPASTPSAAATEQTQAAAPTIQASAAAAGGRWRGPAPVLAPVQPDEAGLFGQAGAG